MDSVNYHPATRRVYILKFEPFSYNILLLHPFPSNGDLRVV